MFYTDPFDYQEPDWDLIAQQQAEDDLYIHYINLLEDWWGKPLGSLTKPKKINYDDLPF